MRQITLPLKTIDPRPVIYLKEEIELDAMLDTGAVVPVWVKDEKILQAIGGVKSHKLGAIKGFGGRATGTVYHLPSFKIGELTSPHLPIIACRMNEPFHMILSATMFTHLIYEIDDYNHKLNITVPTGESTIRHIKTYDDNGRLKVVLAND